MIELQKWWHDPRYADERNTYATYRTASGRLEVYVRRNAMEPSVIEIARVATKGGYGGALSLYRSFCRDIPAIAEQILNPDLDSLLDRIGWSHVYRDLCDIPSRINPAFQQRFPCFSEAQSAAHAILLSR